MTRYRPQSSDTYPATRLPSRLSGLVGFALTTLATAGLAAPPDAGSLLREEMRRDQPMAPAMPPTPEAMADTPSKVEPVAKPVATVMVMGFRLKGLTSFSEAEAQGLLQPYIGQTMTVDAMHRAAEKLEKWLRSQGLFAARAYIPPQELKDGIIEIQVIEGQVEDIDVKRTPQTRLPESLFRQTMAESLPPGSALNQDKLERGLLLMNDLPATSARAVLAPGKSLGASRIVIEAAQGPVVSGGVEMDNTGNRFTGDLRTGAAISLNDPYGFGDQWSFRASTSRGSHFARAGYSVPLGSDGWKIGATAIESRYRLCCDSAVTVLNSSGQASALSGFITYPVIRTRLKNLSVSANVANRKFINRSAGATTSDKKSASQGMVVAGDWSDMVGLLGQGAYSTYSLQWTRGKINLDGWTADKTQDAVTAQSGGNFNKWNGQLTHLLRVTGSAAVYMGLTGQVAGKNLDSSEKFSLGGAQGVRAYPSGEGSGDEGWLMNLEWRQELAREWRMVAFADVGQVTLHRNPWANWNAATPGLENRYTLSGGGASLVWVPTPNSQVSATIASRMGNNPARDTTGRDSDNRPARVQLWLQGNAAF